MSELYDLYKKVGNNEFGKAVGKIAPYFSSIDPEFVKVEPGYSELIIKNQGKVHNHLGTIHAIAICNGAELVAGIMTDVSIPPDHRWIPVAMSVRYLAKATTDLRVVTNGKNLDWSKKGEIIVPVEAFDNNQKKVFTADITMKISEKK